MGRAAGDVNGAGSRGVIVAGGGPAGLEGALALCSLLSPERVCLIAPDREFVHRPYAFSEAFGLPAREGCRCASSPRAPASSCDEAR